MKNLKSFELFESNSPSGPHVNYIITKNDAAKLFDLDEEDAAPGEPAPSDEDFEEFVSKVTGMTLGQYAKWRWPDNPKEQFEMSLKALGKN